MGEAGDSPNGNAVAVEPTLVGPFLRFQSGSDPTESGKTWVGSVLCLTRVSVADGGSGGGGAVQQAEAPILLLTDGSMTEHSQKQRQHQEKRAEAALAAVEQEQQPHAAAAHQQQQQQRVAATQLDQCGAWVFWRFELVLQLAAWQRAVEYSIRLPGADDANTATHTFWLPALGQPMHWGYHSCNGEALGQTA
jgi:hypothetical protein